MNTSMEAATIAISACLITFHPDDASYGREG